MGKRPDDYFAQMAKTDTHMNKIREKLVSKQATEDRLEKVRKLRELKKFGKKVQQEVTIKRAKEKREMLDQVKKFRKGQGGNLDFLNKSENNDHSDSDEDSLAEPIENEKDTESDNENSEEEKMLDSDEELQEAFAAGLLKPGLNSVIEKTERKLTNNV